MLFILAIIMLVSWLVNKSVIELVEQPARELISIWFVIIVVLEEGRICC